MDSKKNWFVRILIILLSLIIGSMVLLSFFLKEPRYTFNLEMIVVLLIDVVLILSEVFDSFCIGSLFSAKKELKNKTEEINKINAENKELRNQLLSVVSTSISSQNRNTNVFGLPKDILSEAFGVEQAKEDAKRDEDELESSNSSIPKVDKQDYRSDSHIRRKVNDKIETFLLNKLIQEKSITPNALIRDVQFTDRFIGIDPIMERNIVFDAYVKTIDEELFIETKVNYDSIIISYNLYYLISKVYYYGRANHSKSKVIFVVPNLPEQYFNGRSSFRNNVQRLYEIFAPAIKNDLLEIRSFDISEQELNNIQEEVLQSNN